MRNQNLVMRRVRLSLPPVGKFGSGEIRAIVLDKRGDLMQLGEVTLLSHGRLISLPGFWASTMGTKVSVLRRRHGDLKNTLPIPHP